MAQSQSKKLLAFSEETSTTGILTVVDLTNHKRKVMSCLENKSSTFISIVFSKDEKTILTLTNGPEHSILLWDWYKQRPITMHLLGTFNI